ncbi:hypothetical protein D3C76_1339510 [compost metagenome]
MNHSGQTAGAHLVHRDGALHIGAAEIVQGQLLPVGAYSQQLKADRIGQCCAAGIRNSCRNLLCFFTRNLDDFQAQGQAGSAAVQHFADQRQIQYGQRKLVGAVIPGQGKHGASPGHCFGKPREGDFHCLSEPQSHLIRAVEGIRQILGIDHCDLRISFGSGCGGWRR